MDFHNFKDAINNQFDRLSKGQLYCTEVTGDELWATYLASFPEGSDPIYRERTEHDCSCCRSFVRTVGNVVAVGQDGNLVSIWDVTISEPAYQVVADAMAAFAKSKAIENRFLHSERHAGTDKNFETVGDKLLTWNHFYVQIPYAQNTGPNYYCPSKDIATKLSKSRSTHDVLRRALDELSVDAIETVLDLIQRNTIYRGEENRFLVTEFLKLKRAYDGLGSAGEREIFAWSNSLTAHEAVVSFRSSAIGSLVVDLAKGEDLEVAVGKYEAKVAPGNYKRTTALVTQRQIDEAEQKLTDLGLITALERRYATLSDISVTDIIFADRSARPVMRNSAFAGLATKPKAAPKGTANVEEIPIDRFIAEIVPEAQTIEVFFDNTHTSNLVSIIAPVDPHAARLFAWNNGFSWSYAGDVADSIRERVKQKGGNVTGDLCCRLAWHNFDDLDLHMLEAGNGHIFYGNRLSTATGGQLDLDENMGSGRTRTPVENIFYSDRRRMREGVYELKVHNYTLRETIDVGFEVEIDYLGDVRSFVYNKPVKQSETVSVAQFKYTHAGGMEFLSSLPSTQMSKDAWGIKTNEFHKVNLLMLSPNHWGDHGTGNKHFMFMLDGCKNDGSARGFYNEFLRGDLREHRKVLEMVGSKMRTEQSAEQLSGLGFSSTQPNSILARVTGSSTRTIKVII